MTYKFEPGGAYRTRDNGYARLHTRQDMKDRLLGEIHMDDGETMAACWYLDGNMVAGRTTRWDLMDPDQKRENVTDRLDRIEADMESGRRGVIYRMDKIEARLAKMAEEHALDVTATDARLDRLSGIINEYEKRFEQFQKVIAEIERIARDADAGVEKLETLPGLATLNAAVVDINDRLDRFALEIATKANTQGVKGELADRATMADLRQVHSRLNRIASRIGVLPTNEEAAAAGPTEIKSRPTIKGGWVNVYRDGGGMPLISALHLSRDVCDYWDTHTNRSRIACIQIPDITEGEGL